MNNKQDLLNERNSLILKKRDHETQLTIIKNSIRSGKMDNEKYKQYCDSQSKHIKDKALVESKILEVKSKLREIADTEFNERMGKIEKASGGSESVKESDILAICQIASGLLASGDFTMPPETSNDEPIVLSFDFGSKRDKEENRWRFQYYAAEKAVEIFYQIKEMVKDETKT